MKTALELVEEIFKPFPCFRDIKLIKTAAIPVIKLTVDTSIALFANEEVATHNAG